MDKGHAPFILGLRWMNMRKNFIRPPLGGGGVGGGSMTELVTGGGRQRGVEDPM